MKEKKFIFPWEKLEKWYTLYGRTHLIWRKYEKYQNGSKDLLFLVWISEILLQQTQAERVLPFLEKILHHFPKLENLAHTSYEEFFPYYDGLGYYSRARNLLKTSKEVTDNYGWIFPNSKILLQKLPWVWPYTASAILAFGYWEPVLAWDTNLEKVFARFFHGSKYLPLSSDEKCILENEFGEYIHSKKNSVVSVRNINNALMDFARIIDILPKEKIIWEIYPLKTSKFYLTRWDLEQTKEKKRSYFPLPDAKVIVILHKDHTIYYTSSSIYYTPYILIWVWEKDTRKYVKSHFLEIYQLSLSVRPVHKKWFDVDGNPYIAVYAQIQQWIIPKHFFKKEDITDILKMYKKGD